MTGIYGKKNDQWVRIPVPRVLVGGAYVACKAVYANVNGLWKPIWMSDNVTYLPVLRQAPNYKELQDVRSCAA